jgi:hypothetical protein
LSKWLLIRTDFALHQASLICRTGINAGRISIAV